MRIFAVIAFLCVATVQAETIGQACARTDTVDHHWTSIWKHTDAQGKVSSCATAYVYNGTDWVAYRMADVTSPPTDIAHHFTSRAAAIAWVESQQYKEAP